jgi:hypothetical protein
LYRKLRKTTRLKIWRKAPLSMPNREVIRQSEAIEKVMKETRIQEEEEPEVQGKQWMPKESWTKLRYGPDEKKQAAENERERQRLSTKAVGGQCQSCGLKKCRKTCNFYEGN